MNRSILIVICDFLLLSLLTFSTDINHMATEDTQRSAKLDVVTNSTPAPGQGLNDMLKQALEDERKGHEQIQQQLAAAQQAVVQQQALANQRGEENTRLQQQYANAQNSVQNLTGQLQSQVQQANQARQQLTMAETTAQQVSDEAAALRRQLDELTRSNQLSQAEQQRLSSQLQLSESERRAAADRANLMQQEVQASRAENAKLTQGFQTLATNSTQLTKEIRDNRALAPNSIFSEFVTNQVKAHILAARMGFMSIDHSKTRDAETVLVSDGANIYAICHVDDTPISFWDPGTDWDGLTGQLTGHDGPVNIHSLSFHQADPRVAMVPVSAGEAQQLGCKVYPISPSPYNFQDAVLVGADDGYYGECNFQLDVNTPQYLKLDRNLLKGLFGKFNPSRGDIVFSRRGELLGIMVNGTYCLMIQNFKAAATLTFAPDVRAQHTGEMLAELYNQVFRMPLRLQ